MAARLPREMTVVMICSRAVRGDMHMPVMTVAPSARRRVMRRMDFVMGIGL